MNQFSKDDIVRHSKLGIGNVITDMGATVIVRFGQKLEECAKECRVGKVFPLTLFMADKKAKGCPALEKYPLPTSFY